MRITYRRLEAVRRQALPSAVRSLVFAASCGGERVNSVRALPSPTLNLTKFSRALLALAEKEQLGGQPLTPPSDDSDDRLAAV